MTLLPRSCTCTPGVLGAVGIPGAANCGIGGMPGSFGTCGGACEIVAVFFTWSSRMVCPAAGSEMTYVLPESTRVCPPVARQKRNADCTGAAPDADCNAVAYSAVMGGAAGGGTGPITDPGAEPAGR
jgi:hypothetical protein